MTLLEELAQVSHEYNDEFGRIVHSSNPRKKWEHRALCSTCRLEKWARDKAKEWRDTGKTLDRYSAKTKDDFCDGKSVVFVQCARELAGEGNLD